MDRSAAPSWPKITLKHGGICLLPIKSADISTQEDRPVWFQFGESEALRALESPMWSDRVDKAERKDPAGNFQEISSSGSGYMWGRSTKNVELRVQRYGQQPFLCAVPAKTRDFWIAYRNQTRPCPLDPLSVLRGWDRRCVAVWSVMQRSELSTKGPTSKLASHSDTKPQSSWGCETK